MNKIVGSHNILFVCLDCLRYDVAFEEQEKGNTPVLNQYGKWRKCQAPGNFTYPSHQAMFAGFMPIDEEILDMKKRLNQIYAHPTGKKLDVIEKAMERDNFMTPQEAKKFGLIDHIVTSREELSK